jgi:glycerol uptake facilitator-like aquaporin
MEIIGGDKIKRYVLPYEFLGTALLLVSVNLGADLSVTFGAMSVSVMVCAIIIILAPICGAHFNAAVTLAVLIREGTTNIKANLIYSL